MPYPCGKSMNYGARSQSVLGKDDEMSDATTTGSRALICPFCELQELQPFGCSSARCEYCGGVLSAALLQTLRQITELPDVIGRHACECGHPEMRRLPDGVFRCPACGSEVLPISAPPAA